MKMLVDQTPERKAKAKAPTHPLQTQTPIVAPNSKPVKFAPGLTHIYSFQAICSIFPVRPLFSDASSYSFFDELNGDLQERTSCRNVMTPRVIYYSGFPALSY